MPNLTICHLSIGDEETEDHDAENDTEKNSEKRDEAMTNDGEGRRQTQQQALC